MAKSTIPTLRFKEFDDEWKIKQLGDISQLLNGRAYKQEELLDNGKYRVLRVGNFNTNEQWYYSNLELEENKYADNGDLLYLWATNFGPEIWNGEKIIYHYHIWKVLIDEAIIDKRFFYTLLEQDKERIKLNTNGSTMVHVTKSMMEERILAVSSLPEQQSIGSLFQTLDELLSAYKDNLANYQAFKATMLSKMFPKAGQTSPEIRLDGFDGEWEEKKLKDISDSIEYGLNASAKEFDGENKYLRITDIDDESRKFIKKSMTSPDIDVANLDNYLLEPNDVLFARTGASVGKSYIYKESDGKVYFAGFLIRIRISKEFDANFVFQNTLTRKYKNFIEITSQRSGQPGVNGKEYGDFKIFFPSLEEQQAIGAFFSNLDELISNYQDKITQLETLKKKLLQDMFI
ncbi:MULTISPECIES: restriction endonuclease subunit S [Streptococcus]|uniref:Restriction endonuclease subunit S n=1 Tax=Streptococcus caledonicus TaxID=2614158 RepID=A0ABW0UCE5_9STRE|nr:restriction endonuclease subunit S [Streptococcus sp. S784/96/1]